MALSGWGLVCPDDRSLLEVRDDALVCGICKRRYPITDGVIRFVEQEDPFYEGAYSNQVKFVPRGESLLRAWPLWLISNGYVWTVRKYLKPDARVIELGCAGGVAWFGRRYAMAGIDLSHQALTLAAKKYQVCLQADDLGAIPDHSADAVISSYFWEHIAPERKPELLGQISRVLKPGGHVVFLYDVATKNPLIRRLRRAGPELYQSLFIDQDGHFGYQTVEENERLFRGSGFHLLRSHPMERTPLQSMSVYEKMKNWPGMLGSVGRRVQALNHRSFIYAYQAMLRVIDETIGHLLPRSWGRVTITVAVKE
jgi:SAM-dependent methyltransferase